MSRDVFERLAELLATPEGLRTARLLQAAGMLAPPPPSSSPAAPPRRPEPISIWVPREIDGEPAFVRPDPLPLGDHYAARKVLRPKKAELPLRVAFFGESVAAGYLYAPHLTPAGVLETQLRALGGAESFEVIDLARTNETLPSLGATVRASVQIQPDMLVLFVGNNWNLLETPEVSPYVPSVRARQRYADALREGLAGPIRKAEEELRLVAEGTFELIALIATAVGIPVIVVVPEVNLADWETRQPVVRLPGDGVARWHSFYRAGNAEALRELDGGTCPTAWRLLARERMAAGDLEGAKAAAIAEVDSARYATLGFLSAPQATTLARDLLRGLARRHGFACVDLREVFARHTGSPLPGRRLFLDYCHLTSEGIEVAMAAVAAEAIRLSGMPQTGELPAIEVAPEVEATARLGAAVHSAHRLLTVGPKREILEHWCEAALEADPGVESAMLDLLEARCSPGPAVLTAAQQRNLSSPYRLLLQHGWKWDHLDADLIEVLVDVLERRGRPVRDQVSRMLLEHHGGREVDLADPFYHWEPLERFYPEVMDLQDLARRATYRSPWPVSSFCLIADRDVELELTARGNPGEVGVEVNGAPAGTFPLGERWTKGTLRIPAALLRPGLNRLTLRWPDPPPIEGDPFGPAIERLEIGLAADLHPVFGEVFSLITR